jgi:hypothetical protein
VGGGLAVTGLLVGGISGGVAISKKHAVSAGCDDTRCPPATWEDIDSARRSATISTVGFVVAGVGIGISAGALLFGRNAGTPAASLQLRPRLSGVEVAGRF